MPRVLPMQPPALDSVICFSPDMHCSGRKLRSQGHADVACLPHQPASPHQPVRSHAARLRDAGPGPLALGGPDHGTHIPSRQPRSAGPAPAGGQQSGGGQAALRPCETAAGKRAWCAAWHCGRTGSLRHSAPCLCALPPPANCSRVQQDLRKLHQGRIFHAWRHHRPGSGATGCQGAGEPVVKPSCSARPWPAQQLALPVPPPHPHPHPTLYPTLCHAPTPHPPPFPPHP